MSLTYRDAGVDIDTGNALVEDIKEIVAPTHRPEVLGGIGGFGSLVRLPEGYRDPILVAGTDGIGTKLRLGIDHGRHEGLGIDLVGMCVNDVVVTGAEPLFFLDYFATGHLERGVAARVIRGVAEGCRQAGCALVGGETAEMPGMYAAGDYDAAGFCVGVVESDDRIDGHRIEPGDAIIGLASTGPHSNGYSLIRRILDVSDLTPETPLDDATLIDALLEPTRIYVPAVRALTATGVVRGMAHITGGGLPENVPRILPDNCAAVIDRNSWQRPAVFDLLAEAGDVGESEMDRAFNCGVGFIVIVPSDQVDAAIEVLRGHGESAWHLGEIEARTSAALRYR